MWNKRFKVLKDIRELIWPLLEPLEASKPKEINESECLWNDNEVDMILQYVEKYSESEESRKKEVESKTTIFVGTFGVATAVLINLTKDLIFNNSVSYTLLRLLIISIMTLAIIYLCRAIWFSIKALERRKYFTMGCPKFMIDDSKNKKKKIIIRQYNNVKKNQSEINIKVDYMTMAQEYFKRAIFVVATFSVIVFVNYIFSYKLLLKDFLKVFESIKNIQALLIIMLIVLIIQLILIGFLLKKIKNS